MAGITMFEKNNSTGPSPGLWRRMPRDVWSDPAVASIIREDFMDPITTADRWTILAADDNATFSQLLTEVGGVARLGLTTDDNEELYIGGGATQVWGKIDAGVGDLAWECRFRTSNVTDLSIMIGMAEEATAATEMLVDDTGASVVKDMVGFHSLTATPTILSSVHTQAGGAQVVAGAAQTMAVDTWYKVGCFYQDSTRRNFWYVDGVIVAPTDGVLESATNFPDGEEMGFVIGVKNGTGQTVNLDIDWVNFAQLRI